MGLAETEAKKRWLMAGISVTNMLKPISTKPIKPTVQEQHDSETELSPPTTPTNMRIPETLMCPPAPRKRKSSAGLCCSGAVEFFIPPDLKTVFIRRVQVEGSK
ncbi:hypothetical protein QQ045_010684 [Rhodiola kirilowii]